jgi:thiamine transport system substrate-binding protein
MKRITFLLLTFTLLLGACAPKPTGPTTLTVMTHDSFSVSESVVAAFEQANNAQVVFLKSGDAGSALNKAILTKDAPLADVFFGVDNTFLSRALEADIFEPYKSPLEVNIPRAFILDPKYRATPVDHGDVCINYDAAWFFDAGLPVPATFDDLLKPEYQDLLVVENPATSSPGLAFLMATIAKFGEDNYLKFWAALRDNGVKVADSWDTAYYVDFSGSSGKGAYPLVVSYASSPPAEVIFADPRPAEAPTSSIVADGMCFSQVEFVGILKGTKHRALAEKWVDFMLDTAFQEDMPLQMFVFPVNGRAKVPAEFELYVPSSYTPATLDPALIAANRDQWIADWTATVVR